MSELEVTYRGVSLPEDYIATIVNNVDEVRGFMEGIDVALGGKNSGKVSATNPDVHRKRYLLSDNTIVELRSYYEDQQANVIKRLVDGDGDVWFEISEDKWSMSSLAAAFSFKGAIKRPLNDGLSLHPYYVVEGNYGVKTIQAVSFELL